MMNECNEYGYNDQINGTQGIDEFLLFISYLLSYRIPLFFDFHLFPFISQQQVW